MNLIRRFARVALLTVVAVSMSGCIVVPLRGWGHEHHRGHGYEGPGHGGDHHPGR